MRCRIIDSVLLIFSRLDCKSLFACLIFLSSERIRLKLFNSFEAVCFKFFILFILSFVFFSLSFISLSLLFITCCFLLCSSAPSIEICLNFSFFLVRLKRSANIPFISSSHSVESTSKTVESSSSSSSPSSSSSHRLPFSSTSLQHTFFIFAVKMDVSLLLSL